MITDNLQPEEIITVEIQANERIAFDGGKVEVDTGNNYLDFIFVFGGILVLYIGKRIIDKWI